MENSEFAQRLQAKIERLTDRAIDLEIDHYEPNQLQIELDPEIPRVVLGYNIYEYSGFARMCVEYSVAAIRQQRNLEPLEFHLLLARN